MSEKKDFFISYNGADKAWAEWIAWQLEVEQYSTILQAWDFRPGGDFILEMQKATTQAERTIAVLSEDYIQADFTQPEWTAAFAEDPTGEKRKLIGAKVRECQMTGMLRSRIYIDLSQISDPAVAKKALLAGISTERAKPMHPPPFPGEITTHKEPIFPGSQQSTDTTSGAKAKRYMPAVPIEKSDLAINS